jgi:hypothetical protein
MIFVLVKVGGVKLLRGDEFFEGLLRHTEGTGSEAHRFQSPIANE